MLLSRSTVAYGTVVYVLLFAVNGCTALTCYSCDSCVCREDYACQPEHFDALPNKERDEKYLKECPRSDDDFCAKMINYRKDEIYKVVRKCLSSKHEVDSVYKDGDCFNYRGFEVCICQGDACNGSDRKAPQSIQYIVMILTVAITGFK